jgi:hypothetical protein
LGRQDEAKACHSHDAATLTERPSITLPLCVLGAGVVHGLCIATLLPHLVVLPADPSPDNRLAVAAASDPAAVEEQPLLKIAAKQSDPLTTASLGKLPRPDVPMASADKGALQLPEPEAARLASEPLHVTPLASLAPRETLDQSSAPDSIHHALLPETVEVREAPGEAVAAIDVKPAAPAAAARKAHAAKAPPVQSRAVTKRREPARQRAAIAPRTTRPATVRRPIAQQPNRGAGRGPFGFLFGKPASAGQSTNRR